ncbi:molybdopterin dinucleotide binding domain-containing protein [Methanolobus mangrovi]|uniref:Molybdopterin dinucleotide binding domain-containing protein n=1 Tax=Methanolobus mangrovi TaxID=3072977 RepID=A0AA51UHC2_9EURY|nr:molybdopterin dinucleotide binding domain-containing protein [Methanolobus mangrovi]WMW23205.1 molybdopterin dinucleotide binding domain-containing protein [Methanolobus mangrovi]
MGFGQFLAAPEIKLKIVTYRDVFQNTAQESSRFGEEYEKLSAVVKLDSKDISRLSIKEDDTVIVKNGFGKVVVKAQKSGYEEEHSGIAYMVNGPWSNALVPDETGGKGVPKFKDFDVTVQGAKGEKVTGIREIF